MSPLSFFPTRPSKLPALSSSKKPSSRWTALVTLGLVAAAATGCSKNIAAPAINEPTLPLANAPSALAANDSEASQATTKPEKPATAKPSREHVAIPGSDLVVGRSRILVSAPIAKVRRRVLRFKDYAKFMPHYNASVVLGKRPDGNKRVFMQVAALRGMVKMGAEIAIGVPMREGDAEIYPSEFIKGKRVKMFKAVWRLIPRGPNQTELWLDVFLHPSVPLPVSLINSENVKGAAKGVAAMKKRVEGS